MNRIETMYRTPHLRIYHLKRRHFIIQINNYLKRTSTAATMKIMDDSHYKCKPSHAYHKIEMEHKGGHW